MTKSKRNTSDTHTPEHLMKYIVEIENMSPEQYIGFIMGMGENIYADEGVLYTRARGWIELWQGYLDRCKDPSDIYFIDEKDGYQLWTAEFTPNFFAIVHMNSGRCYTGYGFPVVAYYCQLTGREKNETWYIISDRATERNGSPIKRYDVDIDQRRTFYNDTKIRRIYYRLGAEAFPTKGITPREIVSIIEDKNGDHWYTLFTTISNSDPILYMKCIPVDSDNNLPETDDLSELQTE